MDADLAIIGAGVIGCALAYEASRRGAAVFLFERWDREGTGTTSRNSGVIHSGLYYPRDSWKARLCVRGNELLYAFAAAHGVPHRAVGKLVVATSADQLPALETLHRHAESCGAPEVRLVDGPEARRLEPSLPPVHAALHCPRTGIVDATALCRALRRHAEDLGCTFVASAQVDTLAPNDDAEAPGFRLGTRRGDLRVRRVVNAAGLHADEVGRLIAPTLPTIYPCRGDYFRLRTKARYERLLYPVRRPGDPGLGVHLTLGLDGTCRLGPDARYVTDKSDFQPADHLRDAFARAASALLGPVSPEDLSWDGCGLRPKLRAPHESEDRDFVLHEEPAGVMHLLGLESPGLTASLALAEALCERWTGT